jgi:hypothetical protein
LKKAIALSALPLALLFGSAFQSSNSVLDQLKAIQSEISGLKSGISSLEAQVAALANKGPRKFYLTRTLHNGAQALSACAGGYHMASMWEILDPSNLRYDTDLGFTFADSGFGPPTSLGWIRTGSQASVASNIGSANCRAWTEAGGMDYGTIVGLNALWGLSDVTVVSPWVFGARGCSDPIHVWCVQD